MSKERELLKNILATGWLDHELSCEVEKLLAQPEQEKSSKWWYGKGVEDTKYFLTREPLSYEQIADLWANKSPANEFECVRLVEKAHGITGGGE